VVPVGVRFQRVHYRKSCIILDGGETTKTVLDGSSGKCLRGAPEHSWSPSTLWKRLVRAHVPCKLVCKPVRFRGGIEISALWLWVSGVRRLCVYWTRTQAKRLACLRRCSLVASVIPFSPSKLADGSNSKEVSSEQASEREQTAKAGDS